MPFFQLLSPQHRVGRHGRLVRCPHCLHAARIYSLSFSTLQCQYCSAMVPKYQWSIGPQVTKRDLHCGRRYKAQCGSVTHYARTKKELLTRLVHPVSDYVISKETIPGWTRPNLVLVIDRRLDSTVDFFAESCLSDGHRLEWVDSSGSRSVYRYRADGRLCDLPYRTFQRFKDFLAERDIEPNLLMHREDPGLGIYLPEIDEAMEQFA